MDARTPDDDRVVDLSVDDAPVLPDQTTDDTDESWGEQARGDDGWLLDERPPHWS